MHAPQGVRRSSVIRRIANKSPQQIVYGGYHPLAFVGINFVLPCIEFNVGGGG
jgi:hypothetical protein